jgi:hypothetical protein
MINLNRFSKSASASFHYPCKPHEFMARLYLWSLTH